MERNEGVTKQWIRNRNIEGQNNTKRKKMQTRKNYSTDTSTGTSSTANQTTSDQNNSGEEKNFRFRMINIQGLTKKKCWKWKIW